MREPDAQLGYLAFGWVTMGQVLSLPMILFGGWLLWWLTGVAPGQQAISCVGRNSVAYLVLRGLTYF